jgi:hypothetical protein
LGLDDRRRRYRPGGKRWCASTVRSVLRASYLGEWAEWQNPIQLFVRDGVIYVARRNGLQKFIRQ